MRANPPNIEIYPAIDFDTFDVIVGYAGDEPLEKITGLKTTEEATQAAINLKGIYAGANIDWVIA